MSGAPAQIGPYQVLGELGRGGMGVVYRVRRADLGREFALKLTLEGAAGGAVGLARLQREAQAAARLAGHGGIVGVHDTGEYEGALYLVMDVVEGRALDAVIADEPLGPAQAANFGEQIARAVAHAHAAGVLHRDLKPANVMITPDGVCRVTDFGLAASRSVDLDVTRLTQSGELLGTPAYMPPEQARGEEVDERADVYSTGATLYECIAGRPPVDGPSVYGVIARVLKGEIAPLRAVAPRCPAPLEAVVMQCLATDRDGRYAGMAELADDLARFRAGEPVHAKRPSALDRVAHGARKNPLILIGGAAALLATIAGAAWWQMRARATGETAEVAEAFAATSAVQRRAMQAKAWRRIATETADPVQVLLRTYFREAGDTTTAADVAAALIRIEAACDAVAEDFPQSRLPAAWRAYAGVLSRTDGALADLEAAAAGAGDDPFPPGTLALAHVTVYANLVQPPHVRLADGGTRLVERAPSPAAASARASALAAGEASRALDWSTVEDAAELRQLAAAAAAFGDGRPVAVPALVAGAIDHRLLGDLARYLRAVALMAAGEFGGAATDIESLVQSGWVGTVTLGSGALQAGAVRADQRGADPSPWFERSLALLRLASSGGLSERTRAMNEGLVQMTWASLLRARHDPLAAVHLQAAITALEHALEIGTGGPVQFTLGSAYYHLGTGRAERGGDGRAALERASELMAAGRPDSPDPWRAQSTLAGVLAELALQQSRLGGEWRATADRAAALAREGAAGHPADYDAAVKLARVLLQRAQLRGLRPEEIEGAFSAADAAYERSIALSDGRPGAQVDRVKLLLAWAQARRAQRRPELELCDRAIALLRPLTESHPKDWEYHDLMAAACLVRSGRTAPLPGVLADIDAGIASASAATQLSSGNVAPWSRLCQLLGARAQQRWRAGEIADTDTGAALQEHLAFAARFPRHPTIHRQIADVRLESVRNRTTRRGDPAPVWTAALADLERQLAVAPNDPMTNAAVASLHEQLGDRDAARKYYTEALRLRPRWAPVERALQRLGR